MKILTCTLDSDGGELHSPVVLSSAPTEEEAEEAIVKRKICPTGIQTAILGQPGNPV
jgi:hypothetical protein